MSANLDKLKTLLSELFMLDQADLDFGIYRVMNAKRVEVTRFLNDDLLPQVRTELEKIQTGDRAGLEAELAKAIQNAQALGMTAAQCETLEKVKNLRAQLAASVDVSALENEVLSDLANFFRRYYSDGDFLALRRYKAGVYAIPYEGEEVKLHWANADQYYIKTSEFLRDYTFKLADGKRVHFKLVEADTEADNKKSAVGQERRFILCSENQLIESDGDLVIRFEYRPDSDKRKQPELNAVASETILKVSGFAAWKAALAVKAPTEKNPNRTFLDKHLADYTSRNSFDYFIHKDIGGFLRRELDFFIKNEIMHLDDIESESAPRVGQYLAKIKAIRVIAHKIIAFLEQLENFQKKLWLKKKFVVETNYCVTLDRVPESLYPEIVEGDAGDAQRTEWVRLFAIDEIKADLAKPGYSQPLTVEFLKANPFLVLDTKFFSTEFKEKLIGSEQILNGAATLDESIDGLLVHSENFNALNLLQARYRGNVQCIYIDPPYNTGKDDFIYKDQYRHSSWLTMLDARVSLAKELLPHDGALLCSIGDHELNRLLLLLDDKFAEQNHAATFIWNTDGNIDNQSKIKQNHEYIVAYSPDADALAHPTVIDPNVDKSSKLFKEQIVNTIVKNGPGNPESPITLPIGFPADFQDGDIVPGGANYPKFDTTVTVKNGVLTAPLVIRSGWSSRDLIDEFIQGGMKPIKDGKGATTKFFVKSTGAPYVVKDRPRDQGHVLTVLRNMGSTQSMAGQLLSMGFEFDYPKPLSLLQFVVAAFSQKTSVISDFFAGSGTTGHAVISLNREDTGKRKYVLAEMGDYFETVLKPRLQKVVYSRNWTDGKPVSREGSSHLLKYIRLESYEDALNNLELKRTPDQDDLLRQHVPLREDYLLRYQLDVETRDSASLLNLAQLTNPFAYQLKIATGSVGESRPVNVDLVETFNYLLGLRVSHQDTIRGFKVVTGLNPAGEKVLVIWRNVAEKSNADLDAFFQKQGYNTKDMEFAVIYVNGDNNLENLKRVDESWKVRRTEDDFKRLMFDVPDV